MSAAVAALAGVVFAVGLALAGMTRPDKIVGFLDVAGTWDPTAAFVMMGAIAVYAVGYRLVLRRGTPLLAPDLQVPSRRDVDWRLVVGAVLFGVGWGLGGLCPGPAVASLACPSSATAIFFASMVLGMLLFTFIDAKLSRARR